MLIFIADKLTEKKKKKRKKEKTKTDSEKIFTIFNKNNLKNHRGIKDTISLVN